MIEIPPLTHPTVSVTSDSGLPKVRPALCVQSGTQHVHHPDQPTDPHTQGKHYCRQARNQQ